MHKNMKLRVYSVFGENFQLSVLSLNSQESIHRCGIGDNNHIQK